MSQNRRAKPNWHKMFTDNVNYMIENYPLRERRDMAAMINASYQAFDRLMVKPTAQKKRRRDRILAKLRGE